MSSPCRMPSTGTPSASFKAGTSPERRTLVSKMTSGLTSACKIVDELFEFFALFAGLAAQHGDRQAAESLDFVF